MTSIFSIAHSARSNKLQGQVCSEQMTMESSVKMSKKRFERSVKRKCVSLSKSKDSISLTNFYVKDLLVNHMQKVNNSLTKQKKRQQISEINNVTSKQQNGNPETHLKNLKMAQLTKQINNLTEKHKKQTKQIHQLNNENNQLLTALKESQTQSMSWKSKYRLAQQTITEHSSAITNMQKKLNKNSDTIEQLTKFITDNNVKQMKENISAFKTQNITLRIQVKKLQQQIDRLNQQLLPVKPHNGKKQGNKNQSLLDCESDKNVRYFQETIVELERQKSSLLSQVQGMQIKMNFMQRKGIEEMRQFNTAKNEQIKKLKCTIAILKRQKEELTTQVKSLMLKLSQLAHNYSMIGSNQSDSFTLDFSTG